MAVWEDSVHPTFAWSPPTSPPPPARLLCGESRSGTGLLFLSSSARGPGRNLGESGRLRWLWSFAAGRVEPKGPGSRGGEEGLGTSQSPKRAARVCPLHPLPRVRLSPSVG